MSLAISSHNPVRFGKSTLSQKLQHKVHALAATWPFTADQAPNTGLKLRNDPEFAEKMLHRVRLYPPKLKAKVADGTGAFQFREPQIAFLNLLLADKNPLVFDHALKQLWRFKWPKEQLSVQSQLATWRRHSEQMPPHEKRAMALFYKNQAPADVDYMTLLEKAAKSRHLQDGTVDAQHRRASLVRQALKIRTTQLPKNPANFVELTSASTVKEEMTELLSRQVKLVTQLPYMDAKTLTQNTKLPLLSRLLVPKPNQLLQTQFRRDPVIDKSKPYAEQVALLKDRVAQAPIDAEHKETLTQALDAAVDNADKHLSIFLA